MTDTVFITLNAGSANIKAACFDADTLTCLQKKHFAGFDEIAPWLEEFSSQSIAGVAHRVVHGGDIFEAHSRITDETLTQIKALSALAPLHQPPAIRIIEATQKLLPDTLHIACFDTVFHRTMPHLEQRFALPEEYFQKGYKRYGFHGLSYESAAAALPTVAGDVTKSRVVVAHLGGGASLCGMLNLKSHTTSMGFSTLDGLMMGTRCGNLDAGMLLQWLEDGTLDLAGASQLLYKNSGLKGVSGISHDVRELEAAHSPQAQLALELFCHMAAREIGAATASLGGIDALVFTGGIGEHSAHIRARICHQLAWLGMTLDESANAIHASHIASATSAKKIYVLTADEESVMARTCRTLAA